MRMNPYPSVDGQCEAAFRFHDKYLNGTITGMVRDTGSRLVSPRVP